MDILQAPLQPPHQAIQAPKENNERSRRPQTNHTDAPVVGPAALVLPWLTAPYILVGNVEMDQLQGQAGKRLQRLKQRAVSIGLGEGRDSLSNDCNFT